MTFMPDETDTTGLTVELSVEEWTESFEQLTRRIGSRFARSEARERAEEYLAGLLSPLERKNGWQLAEQAGHPAPHRLQHLLGRAQWSADEVRDDLRAYVVEHLGEEDAVLVIDETGFLKRGDRSVGVKRQYSGTAGRIENCQVGVFLAYASSKGPAFMDRELYLPKEWAQDAERRETAGVPEDVEFATKPGLARRMLERAFEADVPHGWVVADTVYGNDRQFRFFLEDQLEPYVLAVSCKEQVAIGLTQYRVDALAETAPPDAWNRLSAGEGAKGPRLYDWAMVRINSLSPEGWKRCVLVRRSISDPGERAYYIVFAPEDTPMETIVRAAGSRWNIEVALEAAKGEVGLDQYEVRSWHGWYRHITLSLLAHAYLAVLRAAGLADRPQKGEVKRPDCQSMLAFKQKRGLCCP